MEQSCLVFFTFNISRSFAIDDELYSEIVNSGHEATASLAKRLTQNIKDQYLLDFQYYLCAVRLKRVKLVPSNTVPNNSTQMTLDQHLVPIAKMNSSQIMSRLKMLQAQTKDRKEKLAIARATVEDVIDFQSLIKKKGPRNDRTPLLPGIGVKKLRQLCDKGIVDARSLLNFDDVNGDFKNQLGRSILPTWKKIAETEYEKRRINYSVAQQQYEASRQQLITYEHSIKPLLAEMSPKKEEEETWESIAKLPELQLLVPALT
jgi:hypothetical protein